MLPYCGGKFDPIVVKLDWFSTDMRAIADNGNWGLRHAI